MTKIIYFDICAVLVIAPVIIAMFTKRMNRGRTNRWFIVLCATVMYTALTDIWAVSLDLAGPGAVGLKYMAHTAYLLGRSWVTPVCVAYLFARIGLWNRNRHYKRTVNLFLIPAFIASFEILFINPFFHEVFYISNPGDAYTRGPLITIIYGISVMYALVGFALMVKYRDILGASKVMFLVAVFSISIFATFIQFIFPWLIIECFAIALSALIVAFGVQAPEERLYGRSGLYKLSAFTSDMRLLKQIKTPVNVVIFNISNFVSVRDMLGYDVHKKCMDDICKSLFKLRRDLKLDLEFYYGGSGRFYATLCDDENEQIMTVAQAINSELLLEFMVDDVEIKYLATVCVVRCPEDIDNVEDLISFADMLKKFDYTGEVRYAEKLYDRKEFEIRHNIEMIIDRAIASDNLSLVYQPIYSLEKERYVAAEAFLRLKDPEYGNIPPEIVIKEAEKCGAIHAITTFLFDKLCHFVSGPEFLQLNLDWVELNLSPMQCMWTDLSTVILSTMENYHVNPSQICLNVVDTESVQFYARMKDNLSVLNDAGIRLFMDDFGAGVFEMERITALPLSGIKLDRQFLKMSVSEDTIMILKNSIQMIRDMNLSVVAVGVEDLSTRRRLIELGCKYQQGYYYTKPLDKTEFIRFVLGISDMITDRW